MELVKVKVTDYIEAYKNKLIELQENDNFMSLTRTKKF